MLSKSCGTAQNCTFIPSVMGPECPVKVMIQKFIERTTLCVLSLALHTQGHLGQTSGNAPISLRNLKESGIACTALSSVDSRHHG